MNPKMKKMLLLAGILFTLSATAQQKGDNAIIIKDGTVSIEDLKASFIRNGFAIESADSNYVSTGILKRKGSYGVKYAAYKDADSTIIKGWIMKEKSLGGMENNNMEAITNVGSKGSILKDSFAWMKQFADLRSKNVYCKKF